MNKRPISLNDLTQWSPWPARLLGQSAWTPPERNIEKVEAEYNQDKYAHCLAFCWQRPEAGAEEVKQFELGDEPDQEICMSSGDELWAVTMHDAFSAYQAVLINAMRAAIQEAEVVIELGCGYGFNLWRLSQEFPEKRYVGGEYSQNAVLVAEQIFRSHPVIRVEPFNYYDANYSILQDNLKGIKAVVFTVHSVEQLPSAASIIKTLASYGQHDVTFFHFEPAYEIHQDNLFGLMRRRYAELNDYNRDLITCLRSASKIEITQMEADVYGINPLNSTSLICWHMSGSA